MDIKALFKISQGMYISGAVDQTGRLVGSTIDAVMIAETNPAQVIVSLNNQSYTREVVEQTGQLSLSVLPKTATMDIIKKFGYQSSRTADKWKDTPHVMHEGLPVVENAVAAMVLRVTSSQTTAHHHIFFCDVVQAFSGTMAKPMTYGYYQEVLLPASKKD